MAENIIEVKNLTKTFGDFTAVNDISFEVKSGERFAFLGPNGAGKSTTIKMLTTLLSPTAGSIMLNGHNLNQMSYKEKARNLAIVTQDIEVPDMTVEDYVLMGRLPYHKNYQFFDTKEDFAIAEKYMELTNVSHLRNKYLNQLSGGERQLVAITRALVQEPELLLLDEPTSHLDITHQVQVLNLIQQLNEQLELTVLMIIHDLNLAGEYCDQLILINKGSIQMNGKTEEVLTFKNIEDVYGTVVVTKTNPLSGKPAIFLVSNKILNELKMKIK